MIHTLPDNRKRRTTRQRQVILEELRQLACHPTADELYLQVRKHLPNISLGTVYRNLELLTTLGTVKRIEGAEGQRRYDGNTTEHSHIQCVNCGLVGDLPITPTPDMFTQVQAYTSYQVLDVRLSCIGLCPICQKTTDADVEIEQEQSTP